MTVKISTTNSKLGDLIPSVSLLPECSCRHDAPCTRLCYGKKGRFTIPQNKLSQQLNYDIYINDSNFYFNDITSFLNNGLVSYKYFRWHTVGDIVDNQYLIGMISVANKCKSVKFLCFTKKFNLINDYIQSGNKLPNNLKIIFSAWDKSFIINNPFNFPIAYVKFKNSKLTPDIPALAIPCTGKCAECLACWSLKRGQAVYFEQH